MEVVRSGVKSYPVELILCGTSHLLSKGEAIEIAEELLKVANEYEQES